MLPLWLSLLIAFVLDLVSGFIVYKVTARIERKKYQAMLSKLSVTVGGKELKWEGSSTTVGSGVVEIAKAVFSQPDQPPSLPPGPPEQK